MTTTASTRPAWPSPSIPSPSSIPASATSQTNSYASSIDTSPPSSIHAPAPLLPPPSELDDLDQKMAEFRRYMASKAAGAGPDLILNVAEYATFLPRPFGFKDRSYDRTPSIGSNNINNKCNDWVVPPSPPRTISGYAAGFGPLLGFLKSAVGGLHKRSRF
ncbi:hypothetical protein EDD21DRAFT_119700 [Dissophora ornata]|nr:hypothetical protein EDD21DRAFT_119700 [Dissophora ornata]